MPSRLKEEPENIEKNKDESYDNEYEMKSMLPKVKSSIKENVTSDYTLAILNKDEKEFITENYQNAEFAKEIINRYGKRGFRYQWDSQKKEWMKNSDGTLKRVPLTKDEQKDIKKMADRVFEFFMIQPHMIAILNRNKEDNHLLKILGKDNEEPKKVEYTQDDRSVLQKLGDWVKGRDGGGEDDGYD